MNSGVLIFDVDNTLYDFVDFFGPSFRSMMHAICRTEHIAEADFIEGARKVYQKAGSLEYQFLIQNMELFSDLSDDEQQRLVRLARVAFSKTRNSRLSLYPGMLELIVSARASGYKCVCVTNAPYYEVSGRLRDLRMLDLIDGLVAWEGRGVEESRIEHVRKYSDRRAHLTQRLQMFHVAHYDDLKPSSAPFVLIAERFGCVSRCFSIGDSLAKDLDPAKAIGMHTIWARYGTRVQEHNLRTLLDVTPWLPEHIALATQETSEPDFVADSPRDIARVLQIPIQGDLFA